MSDDPIEIVAKLDSNQDYNLAPFIEYFIDRDFHITAYKFRKEDLPEALQSKLIIGENFLYVSEMSGMLSETFFLEDSDESYSFNTDNYNNIYLPNKDDVEFNVYPDQGHVQAYAAIEINDPKNDGYDYEFRIGLLNSFLFGKLLIITVMYRGSKKIVKTLGYDEVMEDITLPLYPIIFNHFDPKKLFYVISIGHRDNFYSFFIEDDKDIFKEKFAARLAEDRVYMLDYYNKSWCYQDYVDIGILYKYFEFQYYQILLYQKYADNFDCPQELLDKAWQWYQENGYTFMEED